MNATGALDCVVIGYYEPPFQDYEALVREYGERSTAYRDLRFSFVDLDGHKLNYVDLLNHVYARAHAAEGRGETFLSGDIPNLAAVYLHSFLRKRGLTCECINLFAYEKETLRQYLARDPVCVAITTTFYVLTQPVAEMVRFIRECNPGVKIVVGGPLVANCFRNARSEVMALDGTHDVDHELVSLTLEDMGADIYVVESQGEATLGRLIECLRTGGALATVPNIAWFESSVLRVTPSEPENNSLDDNTIIWTAFPADRLGATIQTRTARSCAFSCSFCNYPTRAGKLTVEVLKAFIR
jgi:hypothetical protein